MQETKVYREFRDEVTQVVKNPSLFLSEKINFKMSKVGDRYVKEMMKKYNYNLGGEQSGHIILGKFATTGDGLLVALECLFA